MFKEKLHNDIDRITPSAELLDRVSLMMKEEASRKKPKIYMTAVKYGSIAAAVCIITAVAVMLGNTANKDTAPQTGDLARGYNETVSDMDMMSLMAETEAEAGLSIMPAATEAQATTTAAAAVAEAAGPMAIEAAAETGAAMEGESVEAVEEEATAMPEAFGISAGGFDAGEYAFGETDIADNTANNDITVSEGYILPCENGSYLLINDCMGAVVLNPENNDNSIFDEFTAGDVVSVTHGYTLKSYPGQTTIYSIEKIAEGELSVIPEDTLKQLEELGWIPLTDTREAE